MTTSSTASRYDINHRTDRAFARADYRAVRLALLDFVQARRHSPEGCGEYLNRETARHGLVRARYAYFVNGCVDWQPTIHT